MSVTVQLPGYNRTVVGENLANIVNAGTSAYRNYKQSQVEDQDLQAKTLANQKSQEFFKQASDAASPISESARNSAMAQLGQFAKLKSAQEPATKTGLAQLSDVIQNGQPTKLETGETSRTPLSAVQVNQLFNENPFVKSMAEQRDVQQKFENDKVIAGIKADATKTAGGAKAATYNVRNELQANSQYTHDMGPMDNTIAAANRVQGIIQKIKSGELKSTPTLTTDLSNALGQMFNNGKAATVSGSEDARQGMVSAEGNFNKAYGFVSGQPMNTTTPEQLDQLSKDVSALRNEYIGARQNSFNSWIEGMPQEFRGKLQTRFNKYSGSAAAPAAEAKGPAVDSDLTKLSPQQLQDYIKAHGG